MYIIDKATGYPEPMNAIGKAGENIPSVSFWSPALSGKSKYGGYTGGPQWEAYEKATRQQYIPPLGYDDAAYDVLIRSRCSVPVPPTAAVLKALAEPTSRRSPARSSSASSGFRCSSRWAAPVAVRRSARS